MPAKQNLLQPVSCILGAHQAPPERMPPGPVVSTCPCCRRVTYSHSFAIYDSLYPSIMIPNFPKVLGIAPRYA